MTSVTAESAASGGGAVTVMNGADATSVSEMGAATVAESDVVVSSANSSEGFVS